MVLKGLLGDWRRQRGELVPPSLVSAKLRLLAELAAAHFPDETLDNDYLDEFFWGESGYLNDLRPGHPLTKWSEKLPDTPQDDLLRDGVLVRLGGSEKYAFLHLTFQEYLTARACSVNRTGVDSALSHIYDPKWHEVLILLSSALKR